MDLKNNKIVFSSFFSLLSIALVFIITLYPYNFEFHEIGERLGNEIILGWGESGIFDAVKNLLLFLPFGFSCAWLASVLKIRVWKVFIILILISFITSYFIELLQLTLQSRFPSLVDVIANFLGGIFGWLFYQILFGKVLIIISEFSRNQVLSPILITFFILMVNLLLLFFISKTFSSFTNWDESFPLLVGNETTRDRPWYGIISFFLISNRTFSESEILQIYSDPKKFADSDDSVLVFYDLSRQGLYYDKRNNLPVLIQQGNFRKNITTNGVIVDHENWLSTETPVQWLVDRIKETSQFSLYVKLSSLAARQTGPARIISLSGDTHKRNFTLAQDNTDLVFRLRTILSGENGTSPSLRVPGIFTNTNFNDILVTYDGKILNTYINGEKSTHHIELSPWANISADWFSQRYINLWIFKLLYYFLIFLPLGYLLFIILERVKEKFNFSNSIYMLFLIPVLFHELYFSVTQKRELRLENIGISFLFSMIPVIMVKISDIYFAKRKIIAKFT